MIFQNLRKQIVNTLHPETKEARQIARRKKNAKYMSEVYAKNRKRVLCTFFHEEFQNLEKLAKKHGFKASTYIKESAIAYNAKTIIKPKQVEEKLQKAIYLLTNIANNINQIAKNTNKRQKAKLFELKQAQKHLFELETKLENILQNDNKIHE